MSGARPEHVLHVVCRAGPGSALYELHILDLPCMLGLGLVQTGPTDWSHVLDPVQRAHLVQVLHVALDLDFPQMPGAACVLDLFYLWHVLCTLDCPSPPPLLHTACRPHPLHAHYTACGAWVCVIQAVGLDDFNNPKQPN